MLASEAGGYINGQTIAVDGVTSGAFGVFSVQVPPHPGDQESELHTGKLLVDAARTAGVEIFVHTSVAHAGDEENFIGWAEKRWWPTYWTSKSGVKRRSRPPTSPIG